MGEQPSADLLVERVPLDFTAPESIFQRRRQSPDEAKKDQK